MIGLYYVPIPTIAHETGLSVETVRQSIGQLQQLDFAIYDAEAEIIWVRNMARFQVGPNLKATDKRISWIKKELIKCGKSSLIAKFVELYAQPFHLTDLISGSSKGHTHLLNAPSKTLMDAPSQSLVRPSQGTSSSAIQEQEHGQEKEGEQEHTPARRGASSPDGDGERDLSRFLSLWNENCGALAKVKELTTARIAKLRVRLRENPNFESDFAEAIKRCAKTPFLLGQAENSNGWTATFDWMIQNDTKYVAILEGQYDSAKPKQKAASGAYHSGDNSRFKRKADFTISP